MTASSRLGLTMMRPRNPAEAIRTASPLELFFDLIFVVAVSFGATQLHEAEAEGHLGDGVLNYLVVFFAIWWAWMNFTWFASAFDVDDWLYRVLTLVQMGGVLVLALGIPQLAHGDFHMTVYGYVIMRVALIIQWLRVAYSSETMRKTALRYAMGVFIMQLGWIAFLFVPAGLVWPFYALLVVGELLVPVWAEAKGATPWHPEHIAERFGCFTLIVLGESILASTVAVNSAAEHSEHLVSIIMIGVGGFVVAACMWWIYFSFEIGHELGSIKRGFLFGYGHYFVLAAAGAFSAGITVLLAFESGHSELSLNQAAWTLTIPVAVFVLVVWVLILRHMVSGVTSGVIATGAVLVAFSAFTPAPIVAAAIVMVCIVVVVERQRIRHGKPKLAA